MATAIFQVRERIHQLLATEFSEPSIRVGYGLPSFTDPVEVRIRGSVISDESAATVGGGRRREIFDTLVDVSVWDPSGTDAHALHDATAGIVQRLAAVLDDAGTLDGLTDTAPEVVAINLPDGVLPGPTSGLGLLTTITIRASARTLPR